VPFEAGIGLGAHPGRGAGRNSQNDTPWQSVYDVSPADADNESLGGTQTKGDAPVRGKSSPRVRRTLPHAGQRAGSAGSNVKHRGA
jgi:hypothetical protein